MNTPPFTIENARACATEFAVAWREDCYVYLRPGVIIYSCGPDADHPRTRPTFVAPYVRVAKGQS